MKSFITYSILLISTILLYSCKKYDEDGKRSWHKPEKRIIGKWFLKEFLVDDIDSVYKWYNLNNAIYGIVNWQLYNTNFTVKNEKDGLMIYIYLNNVSVNGLTSCQGCYLNTTSNCSLRKNKTILEFNTFDNYVNTDTLNAIYSIFGIVENDYWDIKKLTDKEMILEADRNDSKHLRLKFQK